MASSFAGIAEGTIFPLLLLALVLPPWRKGKRLTFTSLVGDEGQAFRVDFHLQQSTFFSDYRSNSIVEGFKNSTIIDLTSEAFEFRSQAFEEVINCPVQYTPTGDCCTEEVGKNQARCRSSSTRLHRALRSYPPVARNFLD